MKWLLNCCVNMIVVWRKHIYSVCISLHSFFGLKMHILFNILHLYPKRRCFALYHHSSSIQQHCSINLKTKMQESSNIKQSKACTTYHPSIHSRRIVQGNIFQKNSFRFVCAERRDFLFYYFVGNSTWSVSLFSIVSFVMWFIGLAFV